MADHAFLTELAARYGTPLYAYDLSAARQSAAALRADLPAGARIFYSLKANPHPLLVEALRAEGCAAEVSSIGEMAVAFAAGHSADALIFSGPGKSAASLRSALAAGVQTFSVESVTDRDRLDAMAEELGTGCDILVRLNGPAGSARGSLRMAGKASAFGVDVADTAALLSLLTSRDRTRPVGLHTYFATNVSVEDALIAEFEQAIRTISMVCGNTGFTPSLIDLGGGFPAPQAAPDHLARHPKLAGAIEDALDIHLAGWRGGGAEIAFESGRYLVATAGTLVTGVLDVKHSQGRTFVVADAGVNVLGGMSGLGRLMAPDVRPFRLGLPSSPTGEPHPITLVGPLCTPLDVLSRTTDLGDVKVGELLAVPNTGAYALTASLVNFLSHPLPVEVVHDAGRVESIRRLALKETPV